MEDKKISEEKVNEVAEAVEETVAIADAKEAELEQGTAAADEVKTTAEGIITDVVAAGASEEEAVAEKAEAEAAAEQELSENVVESIEETVSIADAKEAELEQGTAAADEVKTTAEGIITDVIAAGANTEEAELQDKKEAEKMKGAAVKEPPIIKKKKKLDKTNIIVIVVAAVIVIACLVFVGVKLGWFKGKAVGKQTLGDYSTIEVLNSDVEVTDEMVDQYIQNIIQSQTTTDTVTEGVVADGDVLNIDFTGKLKDTGEAFDGGTASGQSLTIGSGKMIPGFEDSLIGAKIGETKTIEVTFPEDYGDTELAGKTALFDVTINSKTVTTVPELTDEFVKNYSSKYLEKELKTVDELKAYVYDYMYHSYLHSAMLEELQTKQTVTSYDEDAEKMLMDYSMKSLEYYAAMYGTTADQYAAMYGSSSAEEYAKTEADYYLDTIMLVDQIIKDKNITWTEEEFNESVALYMARNGYADMYTVDEFLTQSGETWKYLFENLEFKYDLAMEALEPNVVFVDQKTNAQQSTENEGLPAADGTQEQTTAAK